MTRETYRAHPALNFSLAKHLLKSPAHFRAAQDEEREETDAQRLGTLAHLMILEGKDTRDMFAIKPAGMSFATKEGKAWRDAQTLPILKEEDAEGLPRMAEAIAKNPEASAALKGCPMREKPILFSMHGVECKALLDCAGTDGSAWAIGDFKTTRDASPRGFSRTVSEMDYDMQIAWYADGLALAEGLEVPPWCFWIAAEKSAPFFNVLYQPDAEVLASGRRKIERALATFKRCTESGEWPFAITGLQTLPLPKWATVEGRVA